MSIDEFGAERQSQQISLLYFGQFKLDAPEGESLRLESSKKVLAILGRSPGKRWSRIELAESLWPYADDVSARNRLRTALAEVRRALPVDAIESGKAWVELCAPVDSDLAAFHRAIRRARLLEGTSEETLALERAVQIDRSPLLAHWNDSWAVAEREEVEGLLLNAFMRLAELQPDKSEEWAKRALDVQPFSEYAWATRLRAASDSQSRFDACRSFDEARAKLRSKLDARFSRSLIALASQVRSGVGLKESRQSVYASGSLLARTLERMVDDDASSALSFLGSESFRLETFSSPDQAWPMLDAALRATNGATLERRKAVANFVLASSLLHRRTEIRTWGGWMLENEDDVQLRRAMATFIAYAAFLEGEWEEAERSADLAYGLSVQLGEQRGILVARAQIAGLWFHQLRFEEAERALVDSFRLLQAEDSRGARVGQAEVALILGNLSLLKLEMKSAVEWFGQSLALARELDYQGLLRSVLTGLGASQIALDDRVSGIENLSRGLGLSLNPIDPNAIEWGLEFAALALAHFSKFNVAAAALELAARFRAESNHPRSPAEIQFVQALQHRIGTVPPDAILVKKRTRRSAVSALIDHLISMND